MAYGRRKRAAPRRSYGRATSSRRTQGRDRGRSYSRSGPVRSRSSGGARRSASRAAPPVTVRLVMVQEAPSQVTRPDLVQPTAKKPKTAKF